MLHFLPSYLCLSSPEIMEICRIFFNMKIIVSPLLALGGLKETKLFLPHPRVKVSIVGSLRDREVACSASDRQGSHFESCVWRTVSSQSSHHPQEVLLAQFSLYVHKGGLKPDSFHFIFLPLLAECSMLMLNPCYRYGCFYSHRTFSSCTNNDYIHLYEESNANDKITLPYRHRIRNSSPGGLLGRARSLAVMEAPVLHTILTSDLYE